MSQHILETIHRTITLLERNRIDYMLIGGYALPFYGQIRTTIDIDIAAAIKTEKQLDTLRTAAEQSGYTPQICSILNPECVFLDNETGLEIEIWTKLDGVEWDEETLKRRQKHRLNGLEAWVISPEDLIINKLARPDRTVQDEKDVKSILTRLHNNLDRKYLERRAKKAAVTPLLRIIDETK